MPAVSKSQQRAAGMALSAKRGEMEVSELQGAAKEMYDSMSKKELEDFAETEHTGLPDKKEGIIKLKDLVNEISSEYEWLEKFIKIAKNSKDGSEFIKKARKDKNVPAETSRKFNDMYSGMSMKQAADNFVKDVKDGKFD